ncbi:uncharacterized protein PgNI_02159 [Pyricularia grisea]|uniref:Uncharacterized protein n=1 Tax=Pyricularia grisea TaxID=148305 RepID=A0A6P8BJ84_PYRGI|nr:uncharacterized protein PgNI_02159 [Pyricularia grisea]TLD16750.1 hypothetical protein PgNI_02159 [Pyricularia grisea]
MPPWAVLLLPVALSVNTDCDSIPPLARCASWNLGRRSRTARLHFSQKTRFATGTAILEATYGLTPSSAEMVSEAIKLDFLSATVNLSSMEYGNGYVNVRPGLRWGAVYGFLYPRGLVVGGGLSSPAGVADLVLGGARPLSIR